MASGGGARLRAGHDEVFPHGALVMRVGRVMEPRSREERARGAARVPELDPGTGHCQWLVTVIDQAAEALPGTNLRPVVFEGLTAAPRNDSGQCGPPAAGRGQRCRAWPQTRGLPRPTGEGDTP
ncbi:hypothetical protein [Actinoalloteichus caeruleus]|uniref:hypothetical protein n=1 Tax=Actinoalloteichus cyanogriseus TaxID=2893586 RepID=UPI0004AB82BE|nr:hypothetical protein [Actinoalloteichus caeruleus]